MNLTSYTTGSCKAKNISPVKPVFIQSKLEINTPGDKYEQEADAMADRVMRMADNGQSNHQVNSLIGLSVQRKCAACEEEKKETPLMRKAENGGNGLQASSSLVSSLNSSKGGGSPLPPGTRDFMENAFSTDFSKVRVHTDSNASEMSKGISAKAFTHERDIYFNEGQFAPESNGGKTLLAHELTHVVQQGAFGPKSETVQRDPSPDPQLQLPDPDLSTVFGRKKRPSIFTGQLGLHLMETDKNSIDDFLSRHQFMAGPGVLPMLDGEQTTVKDVAELIQITILPKTFITDIENYVNAKWTAVSGKAITFKPGPIQPITVTIPDIFGAAPPGPENKDKSPDMPNFTVAYNFAGHINLEGPRNPTSDSTVQFQIAQDTKFKTDINKDTTASIQKLYQFSYNLNTQQFQSVVGGQGTIEKELIDNLLKVSGFTQILAGIAWTRSPVTGTLLVVQPSVGAQVTVTLFGSSSYPVQVAGQVALSATATQGQPTTGDANLTLQATVPLEPKPRVIKHEPTSELTDYFEMRDWVERNSYSEIERISPSEKERFIKKFLKDGEVISFDVDAIERIYDSNLNEQPALKRIIESKISGVDNIPLKERLSRLIAK